MGQRRWSDDLPPDVLREIAGRLHVAADFVSFHAVSKPWRSSRDELSRMTTTTAKQFLPWLLASVGKHNFPLKLRCVFSKSSYAAPSPPPYAPRRSWVASADGSTLRYLTVDILHPRLHDPLTGDVTDLPLFPCADYLDGPWGQNNPYGIVYGDGTTLLYTFVFAYGCLGRFRAALWRPGDTEWTLVDRSMETTRRIGEFSTVYHAGRILVTADTSLCRVITPGHGCDVLVPWPWMPDERSSCSILYSYLLESHGELLWASVHVRPYYAYGYWSSRLIQTLAVVVDALEEASTPEEMRWVRKDGRSLADRVLFLGSPNSFAVDASLLDGNGGFSYFVCHNNRGSMSTPESFGVFRYNLIDDKTEFVERLPPEWNNEKCTWLIPQPTIAPIQEIIEWKLESQKLIKQQTKTASITSPSCIIHIKRHYEPSFRVLVRNLPPKLENSELQCFFSKHGKVSSAEIIYNTNTKTSLGMGYVTMATMHAHREDALAALNGLVIDGCRLKVILVNDGQRDNAGTKQRNYVQLDLLGLKL